MSFHFPKGFNNSYALVIDPIVVAATLSGSSSNNWGFTATYDNEGNIYGGGISFDSGYPTTTGAFQSDHSGPSNSRDIAITKYIPDGSQQIYATYIGGNDNEQPHSMIVDFNSQLSIYGTTESSDYPTTSNAVQTIFGGSSDIVITKLNTDGTALVGSTYLGGNNLDGVNVSGLNSDDANRGEIVLDAQGNIYVVSSSSSTDFPVTNNAFQSENQGNQDVVLMKLNSDLSTLFWATYLGSPSNDTGLGIRVKDNGEVIASGMAGGASFPIGSGGYQEDWPGGTSSAFVVKLSNDGQNIIHSTFFGSEGGQDYAYFVDLDEDDNVHIYGQTTGVIDITPNTYFSNVGSRQFLAAFTSDLSTLKYSTVIGLGSGPFGFDFVPVAFMVDKCNGIYFSGFHAKGGLPLTPDAVYDGDDVFYLAKLSPNAESLDFATYYGDANHVDGGTSRFDKAGIIYQGVCSCFFIDAVMNTLPNAYSTVNGSQCAIGVFKIDFEIETVTASAFAEPSTSGCVPLSIDFSYTGSDAETFFWDFGTGDTSAEENPSYTFTEAGTYSVMQVVNAPNTCNAVDTFFLQIDVLDNASTFTSTAFCPGQADLFLDVSTANAIYTWQDGTSGASYQVTNPGTYWVDVNIGNCTRRDSFTVASTSDIELDLGADDSFCDIPSFTLDASHPAAASYQWGNGQTSSSIMVDVSGQYLVTVIDTVGCFVTDSINLVFTNTPIIDLGPDPALCEGDELLLDVMTPGANYTWQDGSDAATLLITSSGIYTVEVNLNGCIATDELIATFSPPLEIDLGADQSICDIFTFNLDATTLGAVSYQWSSGSTNSDLEIINSGNYVVTLTNALGCETVDDINIIFSLTPEISLAADTSLCDGENLTLNPSVTNGVPYSWQDGSASPSYLVESEGWYWTLADANGCFDTDSIYVRFTPLPIVDFEPTDVYCYGDSTGSIISINPTSVPDFDFLWSNGQMVADLENIPAGTYQISITDENDCLYEAEITISQPDPLALELSQENVECFGDDDGFITIDNTTGGTPPYLYSLNFDTLTGNTIYSNLDGGLYTVLVQDANDCTISGEIDLYEPPQIFLSAGEDKAILLGDSVKINGLLFPDFNQIINWTSVEYVNCLNCIQPYGMPFYTADFVITSIDSITGCTLRDTMQIAVDKPRNIYIPNAFSPNGDGVNDLFFPYGDISAERVNHFRIYDRWGELVHEASDFDLGDPAGGWDGRLKGKLMNPGVFVYIVELRFVDGILKMYKGDVSVIK
ncbi:MAG: gliding motility-associated-like protein [Gammaproteobacteria bacterium]